MTKFHRLVGIRSDPHLFPSFQCKLTVPNVFYLILIIGVLSIRYLIDYELPMKVPSIIVLVLTELSLTIKIVLNMVVSTDQQEIDMTMFL